MSISNIVDLAQECYIEVGEPTDVSMASISFYLRTSVGTLNGLIFGNYDLDANGLEFVPPITQNEAAILKAQWHVFYLDKQMRTALLTMTNNPTLEVTSDGATVRLASRTTVVQMYLQLRKEIQASLNKLIQGYNLNGALPSQVCGSDAISYLPTLLEFTRVIRTQ